MSKKKNVANLKLHDFAGLSNMHRNIGFGVAYYESPAAKIAKAQSEKFRRIKK